MAETNYNQQPTANDEYDNNEPVIFRSCRQAKSKKLKYGIARVNASIFLPSAINNTSMLWDATNPEQEHIWNTISFSQVVYLLLYK